MKRTLAAFCAFCLVASSTHAIRLEEPDLEGLIDTESKAVAAEAILVGQVLRDVASELEEKETLSDEMDEYFFRALFEKVKNGVKKAVDKLKDSAKQVAEGFKKGTKAIGDVMKGVGNVVASPFKSMSDTYFSTQEKVGDKATKILTKLLERSVATYSVQDSQKAEDFVKQVRSRIDAVGVRLIEQGEELLRL